MSEPPNARIDAAAPPRDGLRTPQNRPTSALPTSALPASELPVSELPASTLPAPVYPAGAVAVRVDAPHAGGAGAQALAGLPESSGQASSGQRQFPARDVPPNPDSGIDVRLIPPVLRNPVLRDASTRVSESGDRTAQDRIAHDEDHDRFALETGQIAAHLRQQYVELDRREQRLHV